MHDRLCESSRLNQQPAPAAMTPHSASAFIVGGITISLTSSKVGPLGHNAADVESWIKRAISDQ